MVALRLRDLFLTVDRLRYLRWRLLKGSCPLEVRMRSGLRLSLRPHPAMDIELASEIFAYEAYRPPLGRKFGAVNRVVDLGGNVGFSTQPFGVVRMNLLICRQIRS